MVEASPVMNRTRSIVSVAVELFAIGLLLSSKLAAEDKSAGGKHSYQEQFLHALHEGPLVNSTPYQYVFGSIFVPKADAEEARLESLSVKKALAYLEQGAEAWSNTSKCVACHTNGSYMAYRPALTSTLGRPSQKVWDFFVATLRQQRTTPKPELLRELGPTQVIYVAAGLAQWDAHVSKALSAETRQALDLMFAIQEPSGAWKPPGNCWPPFEADSYQAATMAAMAVAAAPGWATSLGQGKTLEGVELLKSYLRRESPPHDYGGVFLLWAASSMPDLLSADKKRQLVETIRKHQRPDGGWSIRTFATPEAWGSGNRAAKLRAEPEFRDPPSDGHQTGLAITVLRAAGIPAQEPRIQRGIKWLLSNQRISGRWWTRSLNADEWHFITYSGTCYALLALSSCNVLTPQPVSAMPGSRSVKQPISAVQPSPPQHPADLH
jgi:squalene-hopene/tetraprenyl-beta-curcumene cyclase